MVESIVVYQGEKHCELTHGPSGSKIETDAPKDNMGRGERFSPTDLLAAALSSCVLTTMAISAEKMGLQLPLVGMRAKVTKEMSAAPRRVARLHLEVTLSKNIPVEHRKVLEQIAETCPVKLSLNADVETPTKFIYV